jgi:signal transduction histidine kinase
LQTAIENWEQKHGSENIKIEVKSLPEDPMVFADMELMVKALVHLMQNAREVMPDGGTISVSTLWEDKWMVISVRDNGTGIASQDLPHIFDPFFTKKTYGSGLGLTTVNRIVNGHSGEVKIFSTHGVGTDVRIYIPPFSSGEEEHI